MIKVGVFALQGAFAEHEQAIRRCSTPDRDCIAFEIRKAEDVDNADCIILPGGESTAMRIISQGTESRGGMLMFILLEIRFIRRPNLE